MNNLNKPSPTFWHHGPVSWKTGEKGQEMELRKLRWWLGSEQGGVKTGTGQGLGGQGPTDLDSGNLCGR